MWRNPSTNLFKQAFISAACGSGRRPSFRFTSHCTGLMGSSFHRFCSSAVIGGGSENSGGNENTMTYAEAKRLMRLVNVEALKEKLGREEKEVIFYKELSQSRRLKPPHSLEFWMRPALFYCSGTKCIFIPIR